ncbi:hypothetical protein BJF90_34055 [Pseudonocardia sp. CNS-004]|nr:hypothetical protein BJF90_34055 [Pseudonocardia sp. CNS-004]
MRRRPLRRRGGGVLGRPQLHERGLRGLALRRERRLQLVGAAVQCGELARQPRHVTRPRVDGRAAALQLVVAGVGWRLLRESRARAAQKGHEQGQHQCVSPQPHETDLHPVA